MKKLFITLLLLSFFIGIKAQTPITICPDQTSFSGMTRGYHFTSPTNFTVCGIYVEDDRSTAAQSCEIVRFLAGPPPAYNGTTNNFVSLFRQINYAPNAMISVPNVAINNGDIIGVYGSRGNAVNSYGQANCNVTINGNPTTLQRSGMQANLGATGQMQNIWSEVNYYIGRVTLYHSCCPQPPAISNIFGPDTVCIGDTITYGVVPPANVQSYNWIVPGNATIISGQNTSQLNVVFNSSPGGQICIEYDDTCTTSPQTCLNVAVVPNVNVTVTDSTESCTGRCDGFAYATYNSGGFGPFTYTWNTAPVQVGDTAFNLCGGNYNLTVTDHGCDTDIPFVMQSSPISCCNANVGTNTITMNGNGTNNYVLCDGDTAIITSNLDTGNTFGTNPGLGYAIFECNPTYPVDMYNDPCYTGVISNEILDLRTINVNGSSGGLLASLIAGGANITYTCDPNNPLTYTFTVTLFRKCPGTMPSTLSSTYFTISNTCNLANPIIPTFNQVGTAQDVNQLCPGVTSNCSGGTQPGVWMYTYQATVTLPANCNNWLMEFALCCRDNSTNLVGQGTMYTQTLMNTTTAPCDNSPAITSQPIPYACAGDTTTYCITTQDIDGDSTYFSMVTPQSANGTNIAHQGGYNTNAPLQNFSLNPNTGCMTFVQPTTGNFVVAVLIESFDANGNLIAQIIHDYQIMVIACSNSTPSAPAGGLSNLSGGTQTGPNSVDVCLGDYVCFDVVFSDNDPANNITISCDGPTNFPGATFVQTGTNPATGTFCWTVGPGNLSNVVNFIAQDDACPVIGQTSEAVTLNILNNCNCFMDSLFASIGACDPNTNNYDVTGSAYFTNPPANGLLIVYDSLTGIADTLYPPFVSPFNYNLNNIPSTGNNSAIYVYFTSDPNCVLNLSYTAPVNCQCTDNAGTVTAQVIGSGTNNYVLCDGDYIYIQTNNDYTNGTGPAPGLTYGIYTCPPTPGIDPATDPCYTGYVTGTIWNMADQNVGGSSGGLYAALVGAGATFNNNTIYFAPMTLIDTTGLLYDPNCVNVGAAIPVTYLEPIDAVGVQDCNANTVTVTITGGYPEIFPGNNYNISNLLPVTASLSSTTVGAHGGTVTITGLQAGDMYSFDITDDNGCPYNFSGGPFIDVVITDTTMTNESCYGACDGSIVITDIGATQYSIDNGVNFQAGNTFNNLCPGVYNVIASDGTCADTVIVTITGPNAPITIPPTITNASCFNDCDGQIVVAPSGGTPFTVGNPYTYAWTPSGGNTNIEQNLCAGAYTVRVTDANGCFVDSTFNITQPAQFTYTTASQASFCGQPDGWAAVVNFAGGDGGPYTYDWGSGPTPNDTLFNLSSGPYTVTVSDGVCDTTFNISVANNPAFSASITTTVNASCNGYNDGSATAAGSDPNATYNFLWDANAGNQATPTANNLTAGNYFCVVTDANTGCFDTAFVTITEPSPVVITNISPNITICVGANTNIAATASGGSGGGYTYTWNNGLGVGQNHNVSPVNNTTYEVWATDANGCPSDTAQVTVSLHPVLNVIASNDDSICPGEVVNISALGNGGNGGPYNYTWNNGVGAGQNHNVSPTTTTTYVVTLSDNCSPNVTDSVTIVVKPVPNITFTVDDPNGCEGGLYNPTFFNTTTPNPSGTNSNWLFGDGASASGDTVSHTYTNPGGYDVTLTVTYPPYSANEPGCSSSLTLTNFVEVFYNPVADFTANPNPTTMFEPTVNFFDQSYFNINQWHWNFGGLDTSNLQNPIYTFPEDTGNYPVTLTVTDINGCSASVTDYVIVKGEYGLFVPNAFTPNGDGDNDFFFPKGFGISADEYEFIIFDRWGEQIFYSQKTNEPWDGTYKGKRVQQGVYVWKINFKDINGENHSETGHVSIIK